MTRDEFKALLAEHAVATHAPLCPELATLEAGSFMNLWESMESVHGGPLDPPFWAYSWPGSQALARYVLDHPEMVRGEVVLDLGCGSGLAGLASCRAGARRVVAADIDPVALWMVEHAARDNGLRLETTGQDLLASPPVGSPAGLILVGDLFYSRGLAALVASWLRGAVALGAEVLVGDPGRTYLPRQELAPLASYEVPVSPEIETVSARTTEVFRWVGGDVPVD